MGGMLVFGYGNPGRGDDALGPAFVERLERENPDATDNVTYLSDMQLQVEHVTDLCGRQLLLFVDADAACQPPFQLSQIHAERDTSYTSHAMTPQALLYAYCQVYGRKAPQALLLRIRGYGFELGEPLDARADANLGAALALATRLGVADAQRWQKCARGHNDAVIVDRGSAGDGSGGPRDKSTSY